MEWISVKDRLPDYGVFLTANEDNWIEMAMFIEGSWEHYTTDRPIQPTHWMPLPKPPKTI